LGFQSLHFGMGLFGGIPLLVKFRLSLLELLIQCVDLAGCLAALAVDLLGLLAQLITLGGHFGKLSGDLPVFARSEALQLGAAELDLGQLLGTLGFELPGNVAAPALHVGLALGELLALAVEMSPFFLEMLPALFELIQIMLMPVPLLFQFGLQPAQFGFDLTQLLLALILPF
jgi:hypothetical protein